MKYILKEKPKNVTIVQGLPSIGLVSTITIKYLLDHLDVKELGHIESEHLLPLTAIHKGKIVNPITLYYNKKYNLVLVQAITEITGMEWDMARTLNDISKDLKAKEIITVEGMPPHEKDQVNIYYYSEQKRMKQAKLLEEGIVMGTTAALLLKSKDIPIMCVFAEAHSQLPDSEAAAKVVEVLNNYLGMKVDSKPLREAARHFEMNLKHFIQKARDATTTAAKQTGKKDLSYIG